MPYHVNYESNRATRLAVTGMDIIIGSCDGLDSFKRMLYQGRQIFGPAMPERLQGIWPHDEPLVGVFTCPGIEVLPKVLADEPASRRLTLEEKLLVKTVYRAMQDAGLETGGWGEMPAAILFACESRRNSASLNGTAARLPNALTSLMGVSGPIIDISADPCPFARGLLEAQALLERGNVEAVVVAASTCFEHLESTLLPYQAQLEKAVFTSGLSQSATGWLVGEGAGAIVIKRRNEAVASGKRVYAAVDAMSYEGSAGAAAPMFFPEKIEAGEIASSLRQAVGWAGIAPQEVGMIEVFGGGVQSVADVEINDLIRSAPPTGGSLTCALRSIQASTGYTFMTSGLTALISTALCLSNRIILPVPGWDAPKNLPVWEGTPFYVPTSPHTWFAPAGSVRHAAMCLISRDGHAGAVILSEEPQPSLSPATWPSSVQYLLLVTGQTSDELANRVFALRDPLSKAQDLRSFVRNQYLNSTRESSRYCLALIGQNVDELSRELDLALKGIPLAFEKNTDWQTPNGSCFSPNPLGPGSEVAFVYPGAFNSYIGLGQDLLQVFPKVHDRALEIVTEPGMVLQEEMLYPRSLTALSKEGLSEFEQRLMEDPIAMLTSGSGMAILYTVLMQDIFELEPSAAFGYSLGENSMMFATGAWSEGAEVIEALESSPLFLTRIAGPMNAVREYWKMGAQPQKDTKQSIWQNFVLMAAPEKVQEAVAAEPKVYLTHINAPRQVVIGGDPEGCLRVINTLKCQSLRAPFDYALHCKAMESEYRSLEQLHDWDVAREPEMQLYTAATYGPMEIERKRVSQSLSKMLCQTVDFPRLVRRVYEDGARVFIELGAGSNCARWIDETLKGEPHLAVSINRRGMDDYTAVLRTLARLASHGVRLNLDPLYLPGNAAVLASQSARKQRMEE